VQQETKLATKLASLISPNRLRADLKKRSEQSLSFPSLVGIYPFSHDCRRNQLPRMDRVLVKREAKVRKRPRVKVPKAVCLDALWNNRHAGMHRANLNARGDANFAINASPRSAR